MRKTIHTVLLAIALAGCASRVAPLPTTAGSFGAALRAKTPAARLTTLFSFGSIPAPENTFSLDPYGNLYGIGNDDTIVRVAQGEWSSPQAVYTFPNFWDNFHQAHGPLFVDAAGDVYGVFALGGPDYYSQCGLQLGCGGVYKLTPGSNTYTPIALYEFTGAPDGAGPVSGVVVDANGNVFGTTYSGGTGNCVAEGYPAHHLAGCGTIFELSPSGSSYVESLRYSFGGGARDGAFPKSDLVGDGHGNYFGTTFGGGTANAGTVFEFVRTQAGYREKLVYAFRGGSDGARPNARLLQVGNAFYGTTEYGGSANCRGGCGTAYRMSPFGSGFAKATIYAFQGGSDAAASSGRLQVDSRDQLYGTTIHGGAACNCGTVFRITSAGDHYAESVLYRFTGSPQPQYPYGQVILENGRIFGITSHVIYDLSCGEAAARNGTPFPCS